MGRMMLARIRKWGNSAAFRIPAEVMQEAQLRIDQRVDVRVEEGRLIVTPAEPDPPTYELRDLLAHGLAETAHPETSIGHAVGREILPDEDVSEGHW